MTTEVTHQEYINFIEQRAQAVNIVLHEDEKQIIQGTLERKKYEEMAKGYHIGNIRDKGSHLWETLNTVFRKDLNQLSRCHSEINKRNFSSLIERIYELHTTTDNPSHPISPIIQTIYVERKHIETNACSANTKPGSLIRIKSPQKMGKTLLLKHILANAQEQGFKTVVCDFGLFTNNTYGDYDKFLKDFCILVRRQLEFVEKQTTRLLNQLWKNSGDSNFVTTNFIEDHVLLVISGQLVLALENFDKILEADSIRDNFCQLLRHWHDNSQRDINSIWKRLHLIIIHSTDFYGKIDINYSPLAGVGDYFELKMFNHKEIQELFKRYELSLNDSKRTQLIDLLDGHPYLLTLAIKELKKQNVTLERFLKKSPTEDGIFCDHLRQILDVLKQNSDLKKAYKIVVNSETSVELLSSKCLVFKLYSLGLIKLEGDMVCPSSSLYRKYFKKMLELD